MKYLLPLLVWVLVHAASGLANAQQSLTEEQIDDTWTVEVVDYDKNNPKEWHAIASVNGKVIHGDRLRIRLLPTGGQSCHYGNTFTYFYVVTRNTDTVKLQDVIIPAEFNHEQIQVKILFAQPFLLGYAIFIDLGWNRLNDLKHYFQDVNKVTLTLHDSEALTIGDYFDIPYETWSLSGFNQAIDRAQQACERIVKMSEPDNGPQPRGFIQ